MSSTDSDNSNSDPRDPSGYLKLDAAGRPAHSLGGVIPTVVKIVGTARDDLNGLLGFCTAYNRDRERYMVTMANVDTANAPNATVMALKPQNLTKATTLETYKAQFQQLRTDPRVRHRLKEYYEYVGAKCHPFKAEQVAAVLVVLLGILVYSFGFTKTIMLVAAVVMILCILVEDVLRNRKPWREVVRNFPSRSKFVIEKQFPFLKGKINENVATGIVVLLLAFTVQSVFFTNTGRTSGGSSSSQFSAPPQSDSRAPIRPGSMPQANYRKALEEVYHLGFQDSLDGKDRGHSLAAKLDELLYNRYIKPGAAGMLEEDLEPIPEIPYSPVPPLGAEPAPPRTFASRVFSMRTMGSVFYLYRTAMQVGVDPSTGIFSVAQLAANIQHNLPAWQKGMIAFSCYNLFSNLFL